MNEDKLKARGGIELDKKLIYYPLGDLNYAYTCLVNDIYTKGIATAYPIEEEEENSSPSAPKKKGKKKIVGWGIEFSGNYFLFDDKPIDKLIFPSAINYDVAKDWIDGKYNIKFDDLYKMIKMSINTFYDFNNEKDCDKCAMFVLQSWFQECLDAVFYLDIISQMGGGKTTLLEIMCALSKQGILANDVSSAVIPRIIEKYGGTLFVDEVDKLSPQTKEEVFKILRTGYRKGQKYIRSKPKTFEPESFDCFGAKAFTYRGDVADDLKNRSITINTAITKNKAKPIINLYKNTILNQVIPYIFAFYMDSLDRILKINQLFKCIVLRQENDDFDLSNFLEENDLPKEIVNEVNKVNRVIVNNNNDIYSILDPIILNHSLSIFLLTAVNLVNRGINTNFSPDFSLSVNGFEQANTNLINRLVNLKGRNLEIFYILLTLCGYLGTDIFDIFITPLEEKQEFEKYDEVDYKTIAREVLIKLHVRSDLKHHIGSDCAFHYYSDIQREFNEECHKLYGIKPSANEFKKQLRELDIVDKIDKKVVKYAGKPVLALLYTKKLLYSLGILDEIEEMRIEEKEEKSPPSSPLDTESTKILDRGFNRLNEKEEEKSPPSSPVLTQKELDDSILLPNDDSSKRIFERGGE